MRVCQKNQFDNFCAKAFNEKKGNIRVANPGGMLEHYAQRRHSQIRRCGNRCCINQTNRIQKLIFGNLFAIIIACDVRVAQLERAPTS